MEAAGHSRYHQRAYLAGAVPHPNREVWNALAVQVPQYARVRNQVVRQHHKIHGGVRLAAVGNAGH
jgi:hypothetical protein